MPRGVDAGDVRIATITWARSAAEETLLSHALTVLVGAGFPVTVADRGTSATFRSALDAIAGLSVVSPRGPGLVAQVQAALDHCDEQGARVVLYTEPDKDGFFARHLKDFIRAATPDLDSGIVLASRSDVAFATYPPMQRYTERVASDLCAHFCGATGDYMYGPFLLTRSVVAAARTIDGALGWGWRPFVFRGARALGQRIVLLPGDYVCPPDQRQESEQDRVYRVRQLRENIAGLLA